MVAEPDGLAVSASASEPTASESGRRHVAAILIGLVAIPLIVIDQASKLYIASHMYMYESITLVPGFLDITYTHNVGAAFSIFTTMTPMLRSALLLTLSSIAVIVLAILLARADRVTPTSFGFALIMAGAAGNLIDRMVRGSVIDFIRVHWYEHNFPIFNVADSAITIGVGLVLLLSIIAPENGPHDTPMRQV
ncbi:MAG TPA: signal peptidase II [Candidatus Binataceae bacterium]|nr:signal peptidase II [Candidatus Binataceae bacterium]